MMEIKFCCQSCGFNYKTDSKNAGRKGKCKKCGSPILVPNASEIDNDDSLEKVLNNVDEKSSFRNQYIIPVSNIFIEDASRLAEGLNPYIKEKFIEDKDQKWRYHLIFFQSICFSIHMGCRTIYLNYGSDKRDKFLNFIGDFLIKFTIYHFFKVDFTKLTKEHNSIYINMLKQTENCLSVCEQYLINPNADVSYADKIASGQKSKGLVNGLCDLIYDILDIKNPVTKAMILLTVSKNYNIIYYETKIVSLQEYL